MNSIFDFIVVRICFLYMIFYEFSTHIIKRLTTDLLTGTGVFVLSLDKAIQLRVGSVNRYWWSRGRAVNPTGMIFRGFPRSHLTFYYSDSDRPVIAIQALKGAEEIDKSLQSILCSLADWILELVTI